MFAGSSDLMSAEHTSRFLAPILRWLKPDISVATLDAVQFAIRKSAHVIEYAILVALLLRAAQHRWTASRAHFWKVATVALFAAMTYAAFDEFHQSSVASRTATPRDVMIDTLGTVLGLMICWIFARKNRAAARRVA